MLVESYISISASPGGAGKHAAATISSKYSSLPNSHIFQALALETFGPVNITRISFLSELSHRLQLSQETHVKLSTKSKRVLESKTIETRLNAFTRSCLFNATAEQYRTSIN